MVEICIGIIVLLIIKIERTPELMSAIGSFYLFALPFCMNIYPFILWNIWFSEDNRMKFWVIAIGYLSIVFGDALCAKERREDCSKIKFFLIDPAMFIIFSIIDLVRHTSGTKESMFEKGDFWR